MAKTAEPKPITKKAKAPKARETKKQSKEAELIVEAAPEQPEVEKAVAKAGKRSIKAIKESEAKEAKEERKAHADEAEAETTKPKQIAKPARTRLERRGKKFRKSAELIEKGKAYGLEEAVELAGKTSPVKFDATVELHINLSVDPRQADQNIRDNLVLPGGTGKTVRIAVLSDDAAAAKKAGADIAGSDELLKQLEKGEINFDTLIATPALMSQLGKYARTLGPRGLMPNPKSGTVTNDIAKAVSEAKAGRVEYRVDSTGIIHLGVGKASFSKAQLLENVQAVLTSVKNNKPNSVKNAYFKSAHLTTSMGPSITIDLTSLN